MNPSAVTQPVVHTGTAPIRGDHPNLRKIKAELIQIREELDRESLNEPIVHCLLFWHQKFTEALQHPETDRVIFHFQQALERIFENPLKPDTPFSPRLFGIEPFPLVQFLIAKLRNPHSLLYSARIDAAAPRDNPEEIFARIHAIQRENLQRQEMKMPDLQKFKQRLMDKREAQEKRMQEIRSKAEQLLLLGQEIQRARDEIHLFKNTVERLEREVKEHRENISQLNVKIVAVKNATVSLEYQNAQLEVRLNRLEAEIKNEKSQWIKSLGEFVVAVAALWAISKGIPATA